MAVVRSFEREATPVRSLQPTEVTCRYKVGEADGRRILQLDTFGSKGRELPDKLSQTLPFDREAARALHMILTKEFGL